MTKGKEGGIFMECKVARYWISIYMDKELEQETEKKLFKHIDRCKECSRYFQQSLDINEEIEELFKLEECNSDKIKSEILNGINKEERRHKKTRNIAVCAAILIAILVTIPINGKTVIAYVNDWAKSFTIRKPGLIIKIDNIENQTTSNATVGDWAKVKTDKKIYYSIEDLNKNVYKVEKKPCVPSYLPKQYEFKYALYEKHLGIDLGSFDITTYFERENNQNDNEEYMSVQISYDAKDIASKSVKYYTDKNEEAKAVKIDGEEAIIIRRIAGDGHKFYKLHCILNTHLAEIEVKYKNYKENSIAEEEMIQVADRLVKQIKEEVPEKENIKPLNISEITEAYSEKEFYDKVYNLDDRIVKIDSIPEGYKFEKGIFINNPKEKFNISSDYHSSYIKGDSKINIEINYYNYTNKGSDFLTYQIGEVEKRESLLGYEMKLYKERERLENLVNAISITLPDYSMVINISITESEDKILKIEDMKKIAEDIINKVKKKASKRKFVSKGRYVKTYDSVEHLKESSHIAAGGFVVPTYQPQGYEFMRAYYTKSPNRYLLQFIEKRKSFDSGKKIISISEMVGDITDVHDGKYVSYIDEINVLGNKGYIIKERYKTSDILVINKIRIEIEVPQKNHLIEVEMSYYGNEEELKNEIIQIAESMLKQIN